MLLDQIWKQQLTLVCYGNAYLNQNLNFSRWLNHPIFAQKQLEFRDLNQQNLLAQHFKIWLEALKKQGVTHLSLHNSELLTDEKNPNPNVELLPYAHFIVSHSDKLSHAWICGQELAAWDLAEETFEQPSQQRSPVRLETFWRYELNKTLNKRIRADFDAARWEDIRDYINTEIFDQAILQDCLPPANLHSPYTGTAQSDEQALALIPTDHPADFVHQSLHHFDAAHDFIQHKIQQPYAADGTVLSPEQQQNLRIFKQKINELHIKFIVKAANHYQSAQLAPLVKPSPLDSTNTEAVSVVKPVSQLPTKSSKSSVFKLILLIVVLCIAAYYFGL